MPVIEKKREHRNKYMREYRARKKAKLSNVDGGTSTLGNLTIGKIYAFG